MKLYVAEESIRRLGQLTLHITANGVAIEPAVYDTPGLATLVRTLPPTDAESLDLHFSLDRAMHPEPADSRERGLIVASIEAN